MPRCRVRRCLEAISAEVLFALVPAPGAPPIRPVLLEELARKADRDCVRYFDEGPRGFRIPAAAALACILEHYGHLSEGATQPQKACI